jgi:hypothetical protein
MGADHGDEYEEGYADGYSAGSGDAEAEYNDGFADGFEKGQENCTPDEVMRLIEHLYYDTIEAVHLHNEIVPHKMRASLDALFRAAIHKTE